MADTATAQIIPTTETQTAVETPVRRRKRTSKKSAKDYVIGYLLQGHSVLANAIASGEMSRMKAKQVIDLLKEQGHDTSLISQSFSTTLPGGHGRGRSAPAVGESRKYIAQQIAKDDGVFGRIPLATLGVGKGDNIRVSFERDRLVITRA